mmetsp:Transcript_10488/g.9408  ORF Transcript_10488/g.9408 Transcript_10488/m.9408 type:complete len:441 (-) Transcript_10488:52-1374(-)
MPGKCGMTRERLLELHKIDPSILLGLTCQATYTNDQGAISFCLCPFADHASSGTAGGSTDREDITVKLVLNNEESSHSISVDRNSTIGYKEQVIQYVQNLKPKKKDINYSYFDLTYEDSGVHIVNIPAAPLGVKRLIFSLPMRIQPECASNWNQKYLDMLAIAIEEVNNLEDLLVVYNSLLSGKTSALANSLINDLRELTPQLVKAFVDNKNSNFQLDDIVLSDNLVKSICLSSKYSKVEKAVDLFVIFLLQRLGFYDNRLFAFPGLPHRIYFGSETKDAIPDITIMDILSYFRIAVIEDKTEDNPVNENKIEAQLIAEAIAIYQDRKRSRSLFEEDSNVNSSTSELNVTSDDDIPVVLGIRVKGTVFHFYVVPISDQILAALNSQKSTTETTQVKKLGPLDFKFTADRTKIIQILDAFHEVATKCGKDSKRRKSGSRKL